MRVLLVKTSSMGDVLHSLPALTDAQHVFPEIQFDWAVEEGFAQIPTWHSAVNQVIPVAIRRWRKNWFSAPIRAERAAFRQQLTATHYDAVIDAQGLLKSAFLVTRLAHGAKHGYDRHSIREPIASFFYDYKHQISKQQHAVERIRQLFAASLGYDCPKTQGDYAIAQHFLHAPTELQGEYVVFLHSTTRDDKHWPEEYWRSLIALMAESGVKIKLPWGAEHEYQRALRLAEGFDFVDVLPKLTLAEVALQIANAKAVVSVDTGLSHLTAALDKTNFTLFGPTDPGLIGGYGLGQHEIKSVDKTMKSIEPDLVFKQLKSVL
ncbi:lipopolysaccharide heptosyltransferase RfaC [Providencia stuartii]|uniref:lipopolysaccharide heptosyltransferase RfaC n=1 Tax=Providencia TaxID=586 RepID=UPI0027EBDBB3|nr:lipopolysaccharide heptosyltransferase RfaC [Providencia sp. 2023EL-00965]ELR5301575.1 lipopolysaccharide heptosyltransferase RfaC [Providencia stuartii]MDW7590043.1 lipopolysaccharide heptosyltransferase RfaC [Providencia sp. 2023EL-00965]